MSQTLVKVFDKDYLIYSASDKIDKLTKREFEPYIVKCERYKLTILENQNLTLFSILYDNCDYIIDDNVITLVTLGEDKGKIIAIKGDTKQIAYIKQELNQRKNRSQFMGPLAYLPVRQERTSLLSTESPEQNYRGFINLALLILMANHIRLILENFLKYGFLLKNILTLQIVRPSIFHPQILTGFYLIGSINLAYLIQYLQFKNQFKTKAVLLLNVVNISLTFLVPSYLIQGSMPSLNLIILGIQFTISMKLISYAHTMRHLKFYFDRIQNVKNRKVPVNQFFTKNEISSDNLVILQKADQNNVLQIVDYKHFIYFMFVPTLCFQLQYPRSAQIRKIWLAKRILELIMVLIFQTIIWFQYVEPLLNNSYKMMKEDGRLVIFLDRLLKLSLPNTYLWIAMFFGTFQCWFNILAEVLRFGDRQFYKDWWNCKNLDEYWKLWNLPVHQWLIRHIYFPSLKHGFSKGGAMLLVFLISAIGHEYVVSVSLGIVETLAFFGMLLQAPVIMFQKKVEKVLKLQDSQLGNMMFWISFCIVGQPIMIFVYYFRYLEVNQ